MKKITVSNLLDHIAQSMRQFFEFFATLALGLVAATLLVLPWLLRIVALLVWLIGGLAAIMAIQTIYAPFSRTGEVIVLQFGVILAMAAMIMLVVSKKKEQLWGGLMFGGLTVSALSYGAARLATSEYGNLVLRVLPPALFAVSMIVMTLRLKALQAGGKIRFSTPAFIWLRRLKGGDAQSPTKNK